MYASRWGGERKAPEEKGGKKVPENGFVSEERS